MENKKNGLCLFNNLSRTQCVDMKILDCSYCIEKNPSFLLVWLNFHVLRRKSATKLEKHKKVSAFLKNRNF